MRPEPTTAAWWRAVAARSAGFAALWLVLVEGRPGGWPVAAAAVGAAVAAHLALLPVGAVQWRLVGLIRFVPFFLRESIDGGIDVARRALHPRLPIAPDLLTYDLRLPAGPAQTFFVAVISLLPGTLGVELRDGRVRVHVIDRRMPVRETLRRLELRVADLLGLELGTGGRE